MNKTDSQAFYLSGTYCHMTGTRPSGCVTPQQPTMYNDPRHPLQELLIFLGYKSQYNWPWSVQSVRRHITMSTVLTQEEIPEEGG